MVGGCPAVSGRALAAQARGILGSTHGGCRPFHFLLFLITSKFVFRKQCIWTKLQSGHHGQVFMDNEGLI